MALIERRAATAADLKWTGLIMAACFGIFGTLSYLRGHPVATAAMWSIGGAPCIAYYGVRATQPLLFNVWMGLTFPIGWLISNTIMAITFFLVMTPVGLLMRLVGYDPMNRGFDRSAESYWVPRKRAGAPRTYFRQY